MVTRQEKEGKGPGQAKDITIRANAPARIKLVLKEVDQFLFQSLSKILGEGYFSTFNGQKYVRIVPEVEPNKKTELCQRSPALRGAQSDHRFSPAARCEDFMMATL